MTDNPDTVFVPADATQTLEWITVLSAAEFPYRLSREASVWHLHIPPEQAAAVERELAAYESERHPRVPQVTATAEPETRLHLWMAFWCAHLLLLFFLWLGPYHAAVPELAASAAHAERIMDGEWWRAATALTLHANWPHLLGNMVFLFWVGQAVFRALGQGVGLFVLGLAAFSGNLATAYVAATPRIGVGASTLCFAALGVMAVWQTAEQYRRHQQGHAVWRRAWTPLAAGIALLGMLGTGPQSDLAAHGFGFAAGILLAVPCALRRSPWPSPTGQWTLVGITAAAFAACWAMALVPVAV